MNWTTIVPFAEGPLGLTKTMSGLLMTAAFLSYAIMQVPAGIMADRYSNVRLMGVSLLATGIVTCLTGFVDSYSPLFILRLVTGFAASFVYSPSLRLLVVSFSRTEKGKALGIFLTAPFAALIVLGVAIPTLAISYGWQWGFFASGIPGIVTGISCLAISRSVKKDEENEASPIRSNMTFKNDIHNIFANHSLPIIFAAAFLGSLGLSGTKMWLMDYLIVEIGIASVLAGIIYSAFSFLNVLNKPISGWVCDLYKRKRSIIMISLSATAVLYLLIGLKMGGAISVGLVLGLGLIEGFYIPVTYGLVSDLSSPQTVGTTLSVLNTLTMFAYVVQPALSGYMLDVTAVYGWVWALSAIAATFAMLLYLWVRE